MELQVEYVSIDSIKPYEGNAKEHPKEQIEQIKKSMQEFGNIDPIGVWHNEIVEGHGRYIALKELEETQVPVIRLDDLTDEQRKAYTLIHNQLTMNTGFDVKALESELASISDIDMSEYGFDIEKELGGGTGQVEEDDFNEEPPEEPVSKLGDIYQLGESRLMCGDSTKTNDVERLLGGHKADILITDPPYNVSFEKKSKEILKSKNYAKIENDDLSMDDFKTFLSQVFSNARDSLKDSASYYVFSCQGGDQELMMMMMMRECGIPCRHQIIWVKDAPVFSMGRLDYDYKHEPILYGWVKRHEFQRKGEQDKSVWEYKRTENKLHPTMKPVELIGNALLNSTKENDVVLDLFGGSGSTLIACEQLNRQCFMMELDPKYVDVIIKRWEEYTGKKAEKIC